MGQRKQTDFYISRNCRAVMTGICPNHCNRKNATFMVLKIATAIPVRQKYALPFSYCGLNVVTELVECAHDEIS